LSDKINQDTLMKNDLLLDLSHNNFEKLNSKKDWGPNVIYFTGAQLKVHPNTLMSISKESTGRETKILPLFTISDSEENQVSFTKSLDKVYKAFVGSSPTIPPLPFREGFLKEFGVFLLGNGPFLKESKISIESKLRNLRKNFAIIATTIEPVIDINLINYFVIYDTQKFSYLYSQKPAYYEEVFETSGAKVISINSLSQTGPESTFLEYSSDDFQTTHDFIASLQYVLSVISFGDPVEVNLLGFDGFAEDTNRHTEVQACFNSFLSNDKFRNRLFSGTPTLYDIPPKSIYGF
jgi:hypothetical protein